MIRLGAVALLLPLAAASSDPLAGYTAGPPQDCIDPTTAGGPDVVDQKTILYRRNSRTLYRATIEACPALRPMNTLIVEMWGSRLCRNDRFRVLEPGAAIPSAYCRFGAFTPYTKLKARTD